jgi:hypothetical protein
VARKEQWQHSTGQQVIPCNTVDPDPKPDTNAFSTRLLGVASSGIESTLVQVKPLHVVEEKPMERERGS